MAIKNHNVTPKTKGFTPTILSAERDSPAPIKKSVSVKHCLATDTIPCVRTVGICR